MRKLPAAALISAALHTGAIAWVGTHRDKPHHISLVTPDPVAPPVEPPVMAVTLLDDNTVSAIPSATLGGSHATASGVGRPHTAAIATGHATAVETPAEPPRHSSLMAMRHPEVTHGPSEDFVTNFLAASKPLAPKDTPHDQLTDDLASNEQRFHDPKWVANATPEQVRDERFALERHRREQSDAELAPAGGGTYRSEHPAFTGHVAPDGTATVEGVPDVGDFHVLGPRIHGIPIPIGIIGRVAVDDYLMRKAGIDPYASAKRQWLDKTRDERVAIGKRYRHEQLAESAKLAQRNVAFLWAKTPDVTARKQALFELWDDCAESGDADLVAGGIAAREFIVGVIRSKLPNAYTADELAQLNAHRKSKTVFAPYE